MFHRYLPPTQSRAAAVRGGAADGYSRYNRYDNNALNGLKGNGLGGLSSVRLDEAAQVQSRHEASQGNPPWLVHEALKERRHRVFRRGCWPCRWWNREM